MIIRLYDYYYYHDYYYYYEHTELLSHMINHARGKQRKIIITLLDLKNAFGEVDHRLLLKTLEYHHIPENIKLLISEYYDDYVITIATGQYKTDPLMVGKGVLQSDCLSLLLFNLVVNTLIKTVDQDCVRCMEYTFSNMLIPRHRFQFADDSVISTITEEYCQLLLNVLTK